MADCGAVQRIECSPVPAPAVESPPRSGAAIDEINLSPQKKVIDFSK